MARDPVPICAFLELWGLLTAERQLPYRAARVEMAAAGRADRVGTSPLQHDALALAPSGSGTGTPTAAPRYMDAAARYRDRARVAISTTRPRYITATRAADVLHHRQIVRDEQIGEAELLLQVLEQIDHLRLDRDVERARPVRRTRSAWAAPRARARCRCAGAVRRRTRADSDACGRPAGPRLEQLNHPAPVNSCASSASLWMTSASPMMAPTVMRGLSEANGSWKMICMSRRRSQRARLVR